MPRIQSLYATGSLPTPISQGSDTVTLHYECAVPASGDGTAVNDIIEMGVLPAGHIPLDVVYSATDLDTGGPTFATSFGVLNAAKDDLSTAAADGGAVWASGLTVGQTASLQRQSTAAIFAVAPSATPRSIGYKVTTAATTKAAGTIRVTVSCKAVP